MPAADFCIAYPPLALFLNTYSGFYALLNNLTTFECRTSRRACWSRWLSV